MINDNLMQSEAMIPDKAPKDNIIIQTRQYQKVHENEILSISLSLATPEDVKNWSHGEVTKPETINYKSFKPEKSGLFDEVIFGPITDYKCPICGTKYKRSNEGQTCEKSDECKIYKPQILPKSSRRSRMGHIELASPVVHLWFFTIAHSIIAKILGLKTEGSSKLHSRRQIENIIYFRSHIVLESGGLKSLPKNEIIEINKAAIIYRNALIELREKFDAKSEAFEDISMAIEDLEQTASSKLGQDYGVDFYELNEIIHEYSDAKISTGAKAIEYLLQNFDIRANIRRVKAQIARISRELKESPKSYASKIQQRSKLYKRLDVLNKFANSGQDLTAMIIYNLPIIPADLRPLIQIDGGRHSTSDVNDLYRRIIIRNNRLTKWLENSAPMLIIQNELRMLQESVDALIDNSRKKPSPVMSKDNRPLKSLSDSLSGKKGRFRLNLLGKRVDYSGRSVIVVGPNLKMHQVGIPRQMAAKLFEPWIMKRLVDSNVVNSIKGAKKLVEEQDNIIWPFVEKTIKDKIVLLNRAPTLHRLSIQAFEPVLVRGKAIMLHPLVTTAFNADFDGDQMAVHVPISPEAMREARELMMANKNILGPKDGEPIINPGQDMVLGIYYLTQEQKGVKGEGNFYHSYDELMKAYDNNHVNIHSRVVMALSAVKKQNLWHNYDETSYVVSTVGKFIFNQVFPESFNFIFDNQSYIDGQSNSDKYIFKSGTNIREAIAELPLNDALTKRDVAKIVRQVFDRYVAAVSKEDVASIIKQIHNGNYYDTVMMFAQLRDYKGDSLSPIHAQTLSKILRHRFEEINRRISKSNEGVERIFELSEKVELLEKVWFDYNNSVASVLDSIKKLGFKYSTISGVTMSISDVVQSPLKHELISEGDKYTIFLKNAFEQGEITNDERYKLATEKWAGIKDEIQKDLSKVVKQHPHNPIFMMMESGARSNMSNFVQLAGMRGLMSNSKKMRRGFVKNQVIVHSTIEVPVKSSFLDGLTAYEFYSSTHGARKGLTDIALNTSNSGYLTRRLVDVAQNIVVREHDCGSETGLVAKDIIETQTNSIIVPLEERIIGRYTNRDVVNNKGKMLVEAQTLIDSQIAQKIIEAKISQVEIRSIFGCLTRNGVCKKCYGKDLATNRIVEIGEPVGIVAAQSIGEPGTQLTMRTFHTGGVAGVQDITGGFSRLMQLIDTTKDVWEDKAIISKTKGIVTSIKLDKEDSKYTIIEVTMLDEKKPKTYEYRFIATNRRLRVKVKDKVRAGQKLVEGPIILNELLEVAGTGAVQKYILKEIQKLYRMQGIAIADKYIEIVIRQFLMKILIIDQGDSEFFVGTLVDVNKYSKENAKLIMIGKKPAFGEVVINGAKRIPLLSESFLAAASYQETPNVLVNAAIANRIDYLEGLKENVIVGHKIPAGTGAPNYSPRGKFDLKNPAEYFDQV